jgi:hypothetical protein
MFSLADKCARATEGRSWHSQPTPEVGKAGKPKAYVAAQSIGKNKNRKKTKFNNNKLLTGASTAVAVAVVASQGRSPRGDKRARQPFGSDEGGPRCLVHNSRCQNIEQFYE